MQSRMISLSKEKCKYKTLELLSQNDDVELADCIEDFVLFKTGYTNRNNRYGFFNRDPPKMISGQVSFQGNGETHVSVKYVFNLLYFLIFINFLILIIVGIVLIILDIQGNSNGSI